MSICGETFQQQALEVNMPDEFYDPSTVPQSGEEYLTKVVYERNNCPAIVVAAKPIMKILSSQSNENENNCNSNSEMIFNNEIMDVSPISLRSTPQWQNAQLNDFNSLRQTIIDLRIKFKKNNIYSVSSSCVKNEISTTTTNNDDNMILPPSSPPTPPLTDDIDEWKYFCQNNQPFLNIILQINQRSLEKLLEYEEIWLNDLLECNDNNNKKLIDLTNNQNKWIGSWIYSTIACLHLPLERYVHSILRDIAKTCITLRNKLNSNDYDLAIPYNLFILIISKTFNQLDLFDYV